jgi:hypothetical protein
VSLSQISISSPPARGILAGNDYRMPSPSRLHIVLAGVALAGCGLVDELSAEDAMSFCDSAPGAPAARVGVTRSRSLKGAISRQVAKYDVRGDLVFLTLDTDGDEIVDQTLAFRKEYDANGFLVGEWFDGNADGRLDDSWVGTRTKDGKLLTYHRDSDGDGVTDRSDINTYDDQGRLSTRASDDPADGAIDSISTYVYDETGGYVQSGDVDLDGVTDWTIVETHSADGSIVSYEVDEGADGVVEQATTTTYDAAGQVLEEVQDMDGDGAGDTARVCRYSATGELELESTDGDGDGVMDVTTAHSYDGLGRISRSETTNLPSVRELITFSYENGQTTVIESRYWEDALAHRFWRILDDQDRPLRAGQDINGDGEDDSRTTWADCPAPE